MTKARIAFATALRTLREDRGLSQLELALRVGTNQRLISGYETGTAEPKLERIVQLMQALDCDANRLVLRLAPEMKK